MLVLELVAKIKVKITFKNEIKRKGREKRRGVGEVKRRGQEETHGEKNREEGPRGAEGSVL